MSRMISSTFGLMSRKWILCLSMILKKTGNNTTENSESWTSSSAECFSRKQSSFLTCSPSKSASHLQMI